MRAIVASFAVHAGVAVGLVAAGSGGHASPGASADVPAELLEVDTSSETVEVPVEAAKEEKTERANVVAPPLDHTHPYPVPGHDARPHDPSMPHDHAPSPAEAHDRDHDHDHDREPPAGEAAAAAAVVANDAPKMPVFAMTSGSGSMTAGSVRVAEGRGSGAGAEGAAANASASTSAATTIYSVTAVSAPAKLVAGATAAYPPDARADDVEGDVALEIVVDGDGRVTDARVVKHAGHGFDESALEAIRRYRFSAAQRDGKSVRVRMPWTVQFRLR